jgi:site-specific DNA recombinase
MKAVLFCRVSSKEQEETGYSLPAQEKLLKSYCDKQGFTSEKVFSISESASGKKQRETFSEMLSFVKDSNIKLLICEKADRLTRNFKDMVMIDEWLEEDEERQVHLVKDSLVLHKDSRSQEKLNWGIRILFAKNYIDNLSEEVKKGYKEKLSQGWLPRPAPLGYKTIGEQGHKIHVVDESTAPFIRRMFKLYASGEYALTDLTETLYQEGLRRKSGNKIHKSRIHLMLSDPFYIGDIRWQGKILPGKHEPLIERDLYDQVQRVLSGKSVHRHNNHAFTFKGLLHCSECHGLITWETHKGIVYGHCNHFHNCSQKVWIKQGEAESQLSSAFASLQISSPRLSEWVKRPLKKATLTKLPFTNQL